MRHTLNALTKELRRLKASGVTNVSVPSESIARLESALAVHSLQQAKVPIAQPKMSAVRKVESIGIIGGATKSEIKLPSPPQLSLPVGSKSERLDVLRELVLNDETCLKQVRPSMQVVFGVGNVDAKIMFIGEAPGADEEKSGEPFVGPAGQLLTKMIKAMGLSREDVYIANIMNWRPQLKPGASGNQTGNRPPTTAEMNYCIPYLRAQIEVVDPQIIVSLGSTAAHGLLGKDAFNALGEVRGSWQEFEGKPLMVTYHPSYILRNQTNRSKRMIWEDLLQVMERSELPISDKQSGYFLGS